MSAELLMLCRRDSAGAMQKLVFRAQQNNGFVTLEDCQEVTDKIMVSVIEAFSEYLSISNEEEENEHAAH